MPTAEREGVVIHQLEPEAASVPEARRLAGEFAGSLMSDEQRSRLELAITEEALLRRVAARLLQAGLALEAAPAPSGSRRDTVILTVRTS